MRLWTLSSLLAAGLLAYGCAGGSAPDDKTTDTTSISQLPLSAACSACAQTAMAGACSAELAACSNNPSCFDVGSCLAGCDPNDLACFSACAQASAAFNDLTTCVFCDECPSECKGEWDCGGGSSGSGGGGSTCDKSGDCLTCATCASQKGCSKEYDVCTTSAECTQAMQCITACTSDPMCLEQCGIKDPNQIPELAPLLTCVACDACPSDCSTAQAQLCPSPPQPTSCDSSGDCTKCAQCAANGPCLSQLDVCFKSPDCTQLAECVLGCGADPNCADQCEQMYPNGLKEFEPLAECAVCNECPVDCDAKAWGCPP